MHAREQVEQERTVGQVARLAGVSVRTLHHYDEIGLVRPSGRTSGGYRTYADADIERLAQVLAYRELGFALGDIAAILDDPDVDADAHLRRQHRMLRERIDRLQRMLAALEMAMEAQQMGISLTPEERLELFGSDFDPDEYAAEAEERWGDSDAYRESARRTAAYTKEDWLQIKAEADGITDGFAAAMRDGEPADGPRAMDLAEQHREHITRWFYDCNTQIHRGLAEMYVADPRFTAAYERAEPGMATFVRDAILANAERVDAR